MKKQNWRISISAPILMVCATIATGASAAAQSIDGDCSNRTLRGEYAFAIEGFALGGPTALPLRGVAMTKFDGRGNLSQVDHVVLNGMLPPVDWTPATGTYAVNPDCTGRAQINILGSPFSPVILRFVVSKNGKQINTVVSKLGYVVSSLGVRVE